MSTVVSARTGATTLRQGAERDLAAVRQLAERVWRAHYPSILSAAQIDYMLERGYALEVLRRFVTAAHAGLELADIDGELVGFAAWFVVEARPVEVKLDRLYVDPAYQRRGVGRDLIEVVAARGRALGAAALILNVNKHNASAQAAYRQGGFAVREPVVVDIGGGFVMDDYVMVRAL